MSSDDTSRGTDDTPVEWEDVRRKAGCLLGCLTEPLVIIPLVIVALISRAAWKRRRARSLRAEERAHRDT